MNSKIPLIIGHEYRTRVMKRSFLIITLLTPILIVASIALPVVLITSQSDDTQKTIAVIDKSGLYQPAFTDSENYTFLFLDEDLQQARNEHPEVAGFLYITGDLTDSLQSVTFYSEKQPNTETVPYLRRQLSDYVNQQRIASYNIPHLEEIIAQSKQRVNINTIKWEKDGSEHITSSDITELSGLLIAMLIFMFIFMYGGQVMQGVVQEKSSRIMEVMISSVRPFELMMGKIIGIALVGLTQVMMWVIIGGIAFAVITPFVMPETQALSADAMNQMASNPEYSEIQEIFIALMGFDFLKIIVLFILYFIGGYLLYASLFAAVGSVVDNETDSQQFTLPISIPIMIAMFVAIQATHSPNSALAVWCSYIPFTSPIVMLVRVPYDVAWWEIAISMFILYLSFIGTTWLSGKIYRTGILMYGKKPSWKEIWKWIKY